MLKNINYIDLGVHNGQEIDLFLEQFQGEENYQVNIFGVEANKLLFNNLSNNLYTYHIKSKLITTDIINNVKIIPRTPVCVKFLFRL